MNASEYLQRLQTLQKKTVSVGIMSGARYPDGQYIADVGAKHEFGVGVPLRSFIRAPLHKGQEAVFKYASKVMGNERAHDLVGIKIRNLITESFTDNDWPANAPSTVAAKSRDGKVSDTPLIDTGALRQSITWRVE